MNRLFWDIVQTWTMVSANPLNITISSYPITYSLLMLAAKVTCLVFSIFRIAGRYNSVEFSGWIHLSIQYKAKQMPNLSLSRHTKASTTWHHIPWHNAILPDSIWSLTTTTNDITTVIIQLLIQVRRWFSPVILA